MKRPAILMSVPPPGRHTNPFVTQLFSGLSDHANVYPFTWKRALVGSYEIFHVHWPEQIIRAPTPLKRTLKTVMAFALLARLRMTRTPVILTVHNTQPHEKMGTLGNSWLKSFSKLVSFRIYLNESPANPSGKDAVILHGTYPSATPASRAHDPNYVLYFGQLRAYKGLESLISAFTALTDDNVRLGIFGQAMSPDYGAAVAKLTAHDSRIAFSEGFLADEDLEQEIERAGLLVLPYRQLYNSGALLFGLSHGVPVLVPDNPSTRSVRAEVGAEWVRLFTDELDAATLGVALASATARSTDARPDMSRRDWSTICELHLRIYQFAIEARTARRDRWNQLIRDRVETDAAFVHHSAHNSSDLGVPGLSDG